MKPTLLLLLPLAFAAPSPTLTSDPPTKALDERQGCRVTTPVPCAYISPPPTEAETAARHELFFDAFINKKNLSEAFKYIDNVYKNHNPMARRGGPKEALDILGGIWCNQNFRNAKSAFRGDMGYVKYNNIVDRFRWKDGCITEHWDSGETWPAWAN